MTIGDESFIAVVLSETLVDQLTGDQRRDSDGTTSARVTVHLRTVDVPLAIGSEFGSTETDDVLATLCPPPVCAAYAITTGTACSSAGLVAVRRARAG
jgi:hypothetical protein